VPELIALEFHRFEVPQPQHQSTDDASDQEQIERGDGAD
jgi:hypothetical protein